MANRVLHAAALQPHSELDGLPLAPPGRRARAFAIDVVLLIIPSVIVAIVAAGIAVAVREPAAFDAAWQAFNDQNNLQKDRVLREQVARLLVRYDAEGLPPALALAVEQGNLTRAASILSEHKLHVSIGDPSGVLGPNEIRLHLETVIPGSLRGAALFGVAALYFTLLTAGGRRTLGKRLMRVRVVKLDGQPLTLWESFERFGGYFAAIGTFGLGLSDAWRDPNRRLAHDRQSNTVVVVNNAATVPAAQT